VLEADKGEVALEAALEAEDEAATTIQQKTIQSRSRNTLFQKIRNRFILLCPAETTLSSCAPLGGKPGFAHPSLAVSDAAYPILSGAQQKYPPLSYSVHVELAQLGFLSSACVQFAGEGQQSTLYWLGQEAPAGQQARKGATVTPQLTSLERQVPFLRMANPEGAERAISCYVRR